ncbi:MAG: hypothetical protein KY458_12155 [Actinobacteria bacterium]|nr:hypothetical protein [Actinomycetota bacterium]
MTRRGVLSLNHEEPSNDLWEAALKVVIMWKDFGSPPATRTAAVSMMRQQYDAADEEERQVALDVVAVAHSVAVASVPQHVRRRFKLIPFATSSDIDHAAVADDVERAAPGVPPAARNTLIDWVIYWHWMR